MIADCKNCGYELNYCAVCDKEFEIGEEIVCYYTESYNKYSGGIFRDYNHCCTECFDELKKFGVKVDGFTVVEVEEEEIAEEPPLEYDLFPPDKKILKEGE